MSTDISQVGATLFPSFEYIYNFTFPFILIFKNLNGLVQVAYSGHLTVEALAGKGSNPLRGYDMVLDPHDAKLVHYLGEN